MRCAPLSAVLHGAAGFDGRYPPRSAPVSADTLSAVGGTGRQLTHVEPSARSFRRYAGTSVHNKEEHS